jgi:hypothetical protein
MTTVGRFYDWISELLQFLYSLGPYSACQKPQFSVRQAAAELFSYIGDLAASSAITIANLVTAGVMKHTGHETLFRTNTQQSQGRRQ